MLTTPRNYSPSMTPSEIASRPEVGEFCQWLIAYVDTGTGRGELTIAADAVVQLARQERLDAVTVVGAIELLGCPPLRVHDQFSRNRGDRYAEAMALLVLRLFSGR
jgi:hypothetical protein